MLADGRKGLSQVHRKDYRHVRGRQIKITAANQQDLLVDGHEWEFSKQLTIETMPDGIEYLFNAEAYFKFWRTFVDNRDE